MKAAEIFDVKGHVGLVTGAASGIGLAMAEALAENGARVVMVDMDEARLVKEVQAMRARELAVESVALDVTQLDKLRAVIDDTATKAGRLDFVFANAGMSAGPGPSVAAGELAKVSIAAWQRVLEMNLTSVFTTIQAAAAHMKARRYGRIIVTSSSACFKSEPLCGYAYVATKAGIANVVRQAARELASHNVLVNCIAPGPFLTNLGGGRLNDPETRNAFTRNVPLGRIADTREMKGLALLLASPACSFMTGTVIPIDGGWTA
jgi:NAD(P)-dependent dehydrogenase (short-subunit alcohol dehydrogenase family)